MTVVKIKGNVQWRAFRARGGNWVAVCDPLGLTLQARTWADLAEDMAHTLNSIFRDLLRSGELERFLRDRGWQATDPIPRRPRDVWFDVPSTMTTVERDPALALH